MTLADTYIAFTFQKVSLYSQIPEINKQEDSHCSYAASASIRSNADLLQLLQKSAALCIVPHGSLICDPYLFLYNPSSMAQLLLQIVLAEIQVSVKSSSCSNKHKRFVNVLEHPGRN